MKFSQFVPSLIRTYVPLFVVWLAGWLLSMGIEVDGEAQFALVTALSGIIAAVYYAAVRWVEQKHPQIGNLLGSAKQPVYVDPSKTPVQQAQEVDAAVVSAAKTPPGDHRAGRPELP